MELFLWVGGAIIGAGIVCTIFSDLWERFSWYLFGLPPIYDDLASAIHQGCCECELDAEVTAAQRAGHPLTPALRDKLAAYYVEGAMKGIKTYVDSQ
jgi:hypothetical protein